MNTFLDHQHTFHLTIKKSTQLNIFNQHNKLFPPPPHQKKKHKQFFFKKYFSFFFNDEERFSKLRFLTPEISIDRDFRRPRD